MNRMKLGPLASLADSPSEIQKHPSDQVTNNHTFHSHVFPSAAEDSPAWGVAGEFNAPFALPLASLFLPVHYESRHAYPLLIWLHPNGSSHRQLDDVMPRISERNYLGAALAGTEKLNCNDQYGWLQSSQAIELMINQVAYLVDSVARRFHVHRRRVFIAGLGSGGTMAYRIAFEQPDWFAGVVSLNGSLPGNLNPLSNWRSCRDVPVFWAHGRRSVSFPESNLCHQLRLLHVAGFDVTLRQYPAEDQLPDQVFGDLDEWMMDQLSQSGGNIIG